MDLSTFQDTPIQKLNEDINNNIFYIKRDDLLPISFGGNKARKAVLFFNDLEQKQCDCVVTYGSSSSNHCRIIANIASAKGIPCYIVSPKEAGKKTYNSILLKVFGAIIIQCPISEVSNTINNTLEGLKIRGYKPYFIQGGGHGDIGTQSYVGTYTEIKEFEMSSGVNFDYIFLASGTGTTQAGLVSGKLDYGDSKEVIGISIARKNLYGKQVIFDSVNSYLSSLGKEQITYKEINFVDDYILGGYGSFNNYIIEIIKKVITSDGIPLDTTYTGKAYWGMTEYIKKNEISGKTILFIHTGGTPLFFNGLEELINE